MDSLIFANWISAVVSLVTLILGYVGFSIARKDSLMKYGHLDILPTGEMDSVCLLNRSEYSITNLTLWVRPKRRMHDILHTPWYNRHRWENRGHKEKLGFEMEWTVTLHPPEEGKVIFQDTHGRKHTFKIQN